MVSRQSRKADFRAEANDDRVLVKVGAMSTLALAAIATGIAFPENGLLLLLCTAFVAMLAATLCLAGRLGAELAGIDGGGDDLAPAFVRAGIPSSRS